MTLTRSRAAWLGAALLAVAAAAYGAIHMLHHGDGHHGPAARVGDITIAHVWSRATPPRQQVGAAYLTLRNDAATQDRLLSAESAAATTVELHTVSMSEGVMRMREVPAIDVPAGGTVDLKPGGFHIMLIGLTGPLQEGGTFDLTLTFEKAGSVTVPVSIGPAGGDGTDHGGHMHHKH